MASGRCQSYFAGAQASNRIISPTTHLACSLASSVRVRGRFRTRRRFSILFGIDAGSGNISHVPAPVDLLRRALAALFQRRPAVPFALALLLGILAENRLPRSPTSWLTAGAICLALAAATLPFASIASPFLLL